MCKANQDVSRLEHKTKLQLVLIQQHNFLIYIISIQKLSHVSKPNNFIYNLEHFLISQFKLLRAFNHKREGILF